MFWFFLFDLLIRLVLLIKFFDVFVGADFSTDGKWCYIVFWVVGKPSTRWPLLKKRLLEVCPSHFSTTGIRFYQQDKEIQKPPDVFLLKFWCSSHPKGLLHGNCLKSFEFTLFDACMLVERSLDLLLLVLFPQCLQYVFVNVHVCL